MNNDDAIAEGTANPQAYACMGLTFVGGLGGLFFGIFPTDVPTRIVAASLGIVLFSLGVIGHAHFKEKQREAGFRPSLRIRWAIGVVFGVLAVSGLVFAACQALDGDYGLCVLPIAFSAGIFRFVWAMLKEQ